MSVKVSNPISYICETKEEFDYLKNKSLKLRIILLERKDKNLFCKLSSFDKRTKDKFIKELNELWNTMTDKEIDEEFNDIVNDKLLYQGKDISQYPVKEMSYPDYSSLYDNDGKEETKTEFTELVI